MPSRAACSSMGPHSTSIGSSPASRASEYSSGGCSKNSVHADSSEAAVTVSSSAKIANSPKRPGLPQLAAAAAATATATATAGIGAGAASQELPSSP
eukprot:CAMPEP_0179949418 /NCGR_PEP_ID=MMETSP0983-20121128/22324_1 /TAXON_ID=483367 /ORGANISM="non described non described, Strain CCMP 2436" /LENGTH=96 /DNA_ID=CAMNT_0021859155 /DNA_START=315 /DNA_END=602 /DNA_ORIENTATION=-